MRKERIDINIIENDNEYIVEANANIILDRYYGLSYIKKVTTGSNLQKTIAKVLLELSEEIKKWKVPYSDYEHDREG